jgi:hypothetical protein
MILNLSKIKTEALLLFCRDLIGAYKNSEDNLFDVDKNIKLFIKTTTDDVLQQIEKTVHPQAFYLRQANNSKIKAILLSYTFINNNLSKELKEGKLFNPAMLYFSLLATWFVELGRESKSKEYLYFSLFPYGEVYDAMLLHTKDINFKGLNVSMIDIAEKIIVKLDSYKFY